MKFLGLFAISVLALHGVAGDTPCNRGPDCPRDMCCKGNAPQSQGYCAPLKTEGEECRMYSGLRSWGQSRGVARECLCHDDFYCGSDIPWPDHGFTGTCRPWSVLPP